jgi:thiamine-phosphate pyrophosphorylase
MRSSQPLPRLWLMTDERLGGGLIDAVLRLPDGAGIVFRHYRLEEKGRRALFDRVRTAAPTALLLLAGPALRAQ